jgi:hypothetical protein
MILLNYPQIVSFTATFGEIPIINPIPSIIKNTKYRGHGFGGAGSHALGVSM